MLKTWRIVSKYFVAGLEIKNGVVVKAAPILRYTQGWSEDEALQYFIDHKFEIEDITELGHRSPE